MSVVPFSTVLRLSLEPPLKIWVEHNAQSHISQHPLLDLSRLAARAVYEAIAPAEPPAELIACCRFAQPASRWDYIHHSGDEEAARWSARHSVAFVESLRLCRERLRPVMKRAEAIVALFALGLLRADFTNDAANERHLALATLRQFTPDLRTLVGGKALVRKLHVLARRPLREKDVRELESLYGDLAPPRSRRLKKPKLKRSGAAPQPKPEGVTLPEPAVLVKRTTIARALGVSTRTLTALLERKGFPTPVVEGNRQLFDAGRVASWAHKKHRQFDVAQLPHDVRERLKEAAGVMTDREKAEHEKWLGWRHPLDPDGDD